MSNLILQKTVKNAKLFHDLNGNPIILLENVRLSYPFVGTPSVDDSDDVDESGAKKKVKRYRVQPMLPKATHVEAKNLCKEVIQGLIAAQPAANGVAVKVPQDKWFLADGDDKEDPNMAGHWLVTAADPSIRPTARRANGQVMDNIEEIDRLFVGGHWGHVLIRPWYFGGKSRNSTKTYPKRVSAGLSAIRYWKEDKPFGNSRIDDSDVWGDTTDPTGGDTGNGMDDDGDDGL